MYEHTTKLILLCILEAFDFEVLWVLGIPRRRVPSSCALEASTMALDLLEPRLGQFLVCNFG